MSDPVFPVAVMAWVVAAYFGAMFAVIELGIDTIPGRWRFVLALVLPPVFVAGCVAYWLGVHRAPVFIVTTGWRAARWLIADIALCMRELTIGRN